MLVAAAAAAEVGGDVTALGEIAVGELIFLGDTGPAVAKGFGLELVPLGDRIPLLGDAPG